MKQTVGWNWLLTHGYILFSFLLWLIFYSLNSASNTSETILVGAILWKNDRWWMRRTFFINCFPFQCFYSIFCKIGKNIIFFLVLIKAVNKGILWLQAVAFYLPALKIQKKHGIRSLKWHLFLVASKFASASFTISSQIWASALPVLILKLLFWF